MWGVALVPPAPPPTSAKVTVTATVVTGYADARRQHRWLDPRRPHIMIYIRIECYMWIVCTLTVIAFMRCSIHAMRLKAFHGVARPELYVGIASRRTTDDGREQNTIVIMFII